MAYGIVVDGALNCRQSPSASAPSYGTFPNGTRLSVSDVPSAPDWYQTTWTSGATGYVMKQYIVSAGDTIQVKGSNVNVRSGAGTTNPVLYMLSNPATAPVQDVATASDGGWIKIAPSGMATGWIRYDFVTKYSSGSGGGGGTGWNGVKNGAFTLKYGGSSNDASAVQTLQQFLKNIGYGTQNVGNLTVDGIFGSITDAAVKKFQYESGFVENGVVGATVAIQLETVQSDPWFTKPEYYPLSTSYMTYANYPNMGTDEKTQRSIVMRAISAEHGYPGSTAAGHHDARVGVAKVLKNRTNPAFNVNRANPSDYSFKSVFMSSDYTSKTSLGACYLPRGYSYVMQQMHDAAAAVVAGGWPAGATKIGTSHIFQKGSGAWNSSYESKTGYCRYPETGSPFSFFYC